MRLCYPWIYRKPRSHCRTVICIHSRSLADKSVIMPIQSNELPTGTVTFLFTDIVGSTEMWEQHGDAFLPVLQAHNAIMMDAITRYGGYLIKTEGEAYT